MQHGAGQTSHFSLCQLLVFVVSKISNFVHSCKLIHIHIQQYLRYRKTTFGAASLSAYKTLAPKVDPFWPTLYHFNCSSLLEQANRCLGLYEILG